MSKQGDGKSVINIAKPFFQSNQFHLVKRIF